jgi:hypothetical protein
MRKLRILWRGLPGESLREELETWAYVLLTVGAALLLYATLKAQAAHAATFLAWPAPALPAGSFGGPLAQTVGSSPDAPPRIAPRSARPANAHPLVSPCTGHRRRRDAGALTGRRSPALHDR